MALYLTTESSVACKLHPVVGLGIIDHFMRRPEGQERVIGTLLGSRGPSGEIEIKNCFPVPHSETDEQVAVDMEFHKTMLDLHRRVNPDESVVGWYATGTQVTENSVLIHDFYGHETAVPVHLTVDTLMAEGHLAIKAYVSSMLSVDGGALGTQFHPIEIVMASFEAERIGLDLLRRSLAAKDGTTRVVSEMANLEMSMDALAKQLDVVIAHVDRVLAGTVPADPALGRFLLDGVAAIPTVKQADYLRMFDTNIRDLLMVVYLANLVRTQLYLGERIDRVVTRHQREIDPKAVYGSRGERGRGRGRGRGRRGGRADAGPTAAGQASASAPASRGRW